MIRAATGFLFAITTGAALLRAGIWALDRLWVWVTILQIRGSL